MVAPIQKLMVVKTNFPFFFGTRRFSRRSANLKFLADYTTHFYKRKYRIKFALYPVPSWIYFKIYMYLSIILAKLYSVLFYVQIK